ncbi:hypothetical protein ON010_g5978 [Phytophthora cinnamomi]|nr:hypothetical protein ON010_g5978 [Phytophthora cinnamomi]
MGQVYHSEYQDEQDGTIARSLAEQHVVPAVEVQKSGRVSLLRQPVAAVTAERVYHGQVVYSSGDSVTVAVGGEELSIKYSETIEVAPAKASLTKMDFPNPITFVVGFIQPQAVGQNFPYSMQLTSHTTLTEEFNRSLSPSVTYSVYRRYPPDASNHETSDRHNPLFDPFQDDDDTAPDHSETVEIVEKGCANLAGAKRTREDISQTTRRAPNPKRRLQSTLPARDRDASIIAKLMDELELLEHFLSLRQNRASSQSGEEIAKPSRTPVPRDGTKSIKHSFAP